MDAIMNLREPAASPQPAHLPADRRRWPEAAGLACDRLLAELDQWSREQGWTRSGNAWIAEEAVRRDWELERPDGDSRNSTEFVIDS